MNTGQKRIFFFLISFVCRANNEPVKERLDRWLGKVIMKSRATAESYMGGDKIMKFVDIALV